MLIVITTLKIRVQSETKLLWEGCPHLLKMFSIMRYKWGGTIKQMSSRYFKLKNMLS